MERFRAQHPVMPPVLRKRVPVGSDPPATEHARDHHQIARPIKCRQQALFTKFFGIGYSVIVIFSFYLAISVQL